VGDLIVDVGRALEKASIVRGDAGRARLVGDGQHLHQPKAIQPGPKFNLTWYGSTWLDNAPERRLQDHARLLLVQGAAKGKVVQAARVAARQFGQCLRVTG
jgi:hypothetical protein